MGSRRFRHSNLELMVQSSYHPSVDWVHEVFGDCSLTTLQSTSREDRRRKCGVQALLQLSLSGQLIFVDDVILLNVLTV